jgi:hypothetical protein
MDDVDSEFFPLQLSTHITANLDLSGSSKSKPLEIDRWMERERMPTSRSIGPSDCLVTSLIQKAVQCGEKVPLSTIHESVN